MVIFLSTAMAGMAAKGALFPNAVYAARSVDEAKPGNKLPVAEAKDIAVPSTEAKKPEDVEVEQVSGEQANAQQVNVPRRLPDIPNYNLTEFDPEDTREENFEFVKAQAVSGSTDRVSLLVHSEDSQALATIYQAAQEYVVQEDEGREVQFFWTQDKDNNPNTIDVDIFGDAIKTETYKIRNKNDRAGIKKDIKDALNDAYNDEVAPVKAQRQLSKILQPNKMMKNKRQKTKKNLKNRPKNN